MKLYNRQIYQAFGAQNISKIDSQSRQDRLFIVHTINTQIIQLGGYIKLVVVAQVNDRRLSEYLRGKHLHPTHGLTIHLQDQELK